MSTCMRSHAVGVISGHQCGHQWPSVATNVVISGHQWPPTWSSVAISGHQCGHQWPSAPTWSIKEPKAIRGHQRPSEVISGHQRHLVDQRTQSHQRPSEAIRGHQRSSVAISAHLVDQRTQSPCGRDAPPTRPPYQSSRPHPRPHSMPQLPRERRHSEQRAIRRCRPPAHLWGERASW